MELLNLIIPFILAFVGMSITLGLFWLILAPALGAIQSRKDTNKLRKASQRLERVDALIAERKCIEALRLLRRSVIPDIVTKQHFLEAIRDHHQNILSRCLIISEELGTRADNIADVEGLLMQRSELQSLHIKAAESFLNLKNRREKAGKDIPTWSKADFESRVKEIRKELDINLASLTVALDKLFTALESLQPEHIVYH